jgi:hypothetical protein
MYSRVEQTFYLMAAILLMSAMFIISPDSRRTGDELARFKQEVRFAISSSIGQTMPNADPRHNFEFVFDSSRQFYRQSAAIAAPLMVPKEGSLEVLAAIINHGNETAKISSNISQARTAIFDYGKMQINAAHTVVASKINAVQLHTVKRKPVAVNESALKPNFVNLELIDPEPVKDIIPDFVKEYRRNKDALTLIPLDPKEIARLPEEGRVAGASVSKRLMPPNWSTLTDNITGQQYCIALFNGEVSKYAGECKYDL